MIHYRPGFQPRTSDLAPAKLNEDMIPALHKQTKTIDTSTPLKVNLPELTDAQVEKAVAFAEAAKKLATLHTPEIIANPHPSTPPILTTPHQE